MKPNFEEMSVLELRMYVLEHSDDMEAIRTLFHHPRFKWKSMPHLFREDGSPIEENIHNVEEEIRQHLS